jgi:hypothetical protein
MRARLLKALTGALGLVLVAVLVAATVATSTAPRTGVTTGPSFNVPVSLVALAGSAKHVQVDVPHGTPVAAPKAAPAVQPPAPTIVLLAAHAQAVTARGPPHWAGGCSYKMVPNSASFHVSFTEDVVRDSCHLAMQALAYCASGGVRHGNVVYRKWVDGKRQKSRAACPSRINYITRAGYRFEQAWVQSNGKRHLRWRYRTFVTA